MYSTKNDEAKEQSIKIMKDAVMSYRVSELKELLRMFTVPRSNVPKAKLQQQVLGIIDSLKCSFASIPPKFIRKILELESRVKNKVDGRRRSVTISDRNLAIYGKSPFFDQVQVLVSSQTIRSPSCVFLNIPLKSVQLLRKKKSAEDLYTREIQFVFRPENANEEWTPTTIRLRVNEEKEVEILESPPIVYVTQYCRLGKNVLNKFEIEFPDNEKDLKLTVSVVRRFTPSQLLKAKAVKEVCNVRNMLEKHFNDSEDLVYEVSLVCPFEKKILIHPCRSSYCSHPDVFDLIYFLEKMQYYFFWKCPVCQCPVTYKSLESESFFKTYLEQGKVNYTFYKKRKDIFSGVTAKESEEVITLD